jgi:aminocarboxymuconate-semialdehyde decarboxylase
MFGCSCCGLSRRQVLGGAFAASAVAATGMRKAQAQLGAPATLKASGVRSVDIHAHYYTDGFLDVIRTDGARFNAEASKGERTFGFKTPVGAQPALPLKFIDLKERLADMDEQGIAVHALSLTTPMVYWADGEVSHKLAQAWNDGAVAAHKAHPDRFVVLATLPMLDADRAIDELNRVSQLPGVRGIYMGTNINGRDLDNPQFTPIFARIEALDLPVFLHPLQTVGGQRLQDFYLANLIGNPVDTAIAASRLIFGGVLDRHPRLQITLPHAGGVLPVLIGRMDHGWKVRAETKKSVIAGAPSSYLRRFTYDTISHSKPIMEFVISLVGADRIMIGSDYCYDMGYQQPVQVVEELGLSAEEKKMILGGTAAKLLKL